jgi:hypothetical protein
LKADYIIKNSKEVITIGLDMYLNRRKYIGNKYKDKDKQAIIVADGVDQAKVSEVVEEAACWRKANAIHQWFVENVQAGEDDCKEYRVGHEELQALYAVVCKVLESCELVPAKISNGYTFKNGKKEPILVDGKKVKNDKVARELLPTTEGFFFGATDYDEYYVEDLKYTKKILEDALKDESADYYYQSSW